MFGIVEFKSVLALGECLICNDEMADTKALAHEGKCEPCHEDCIKTWVKIRNICPKCHAIVDVNNLFSWKERAITKLNSNFIKTAKNITIGMLSGVISLLSTKILKKVITDLGVAEDVAKVVSVGVGAGIGAAVGGGVGIVAIELRIEEVVAEVLGIGVAGGVGAGIGIVGIGVFIANLNDQG